MRSSLAPLKSIYYRYMVQIWHTLAACTFLSVKESAEPHFASDLRVTGTPPRATKSMELFPLCDV